MLKPVDILIALKTEKPALVKGLPDARLLNLIRSTLVQVGDAVEKSTGEEPLRVPGLGVFTNKVGKKVVDGREVATARVVFKRLAPVKPAANKVGGPVAR